MTEFRKWRSINKFSDAWKLAQKFGVLQLTYNAKVKLHGTNAGIRIMPDGSLVGQKRSSDVSIGNDNAGFASFVAGLKYDKLYAQEFMPGVIIYGEWAGKGIQKTDAVSTVDKAFYVFAAYAPKIDRIIYEPAELEIIMNAIFDMEVVEQRMHVLPWFFDDDIAVDMTDPIKAKPFAEKATFLVDEIGKGDPYIKDLHGVEGPGEGLVFYCTSIRTGLDGLLSGDKLNEMLMGYMFKHKTEVHSVNKSKDRSHVAPEKPAGVDEFCDMFVTDARLQQMITDNEIEVDRRNTGAIMKAMMSDIHKESAAEVEAADFEWKDVTKYVTTQIKLKWFKLCDELQ